MFKFSVILSFFVFFFKQKTAYEMRISDWSSDVCSSDLHGREGLVAARLEARGVERRAGCEDNAVGRPRLDAPDRIVGDARVGRPHGDFGLGREIGRASCRERVCQYV